MIFLLFSLLSSSLEFISKFFFVFENPIFVLQPFSIYQTGRFLLNDKIFDHW
jgi:hypothetical protein